MLLGISYKGIQALEKKRGTMKSIITIIITLLATASSICGQATPGLGLKQRGSSAVITLPCSDGNEAYAIRHVRESRWSRLQDAFETRFPDETYRFDCSGNSLAWMDIEIERRGEDRSTFLVESCSSTAECRWEQLGAVTYVETPPRPASNCETKVFTWTTPNGEARGVGSHDWMRTEVTSEGRILMRVVSPAITESEALKVAYTDTDEPQINEWPKSAVERMNPSGRILPMERWIRFNERTSRVMLDSDGPWRIVFGYVVDDGPFEGNFMPLSGVASCSPPDQGEME